MQTMTLMVCQKKNESDIFYSQGNIEVFTRKIKDLVYDKLLNDLK